MTKVTIDKRSATYRAWTAMCQQTEHSVCHRWRESYENFLIDLGERPSRKHSLYRENGDGSFCPANCSWRLPKDQNNFRCECGRACSAH